MLKVLCNVRGFLEMGIGPRWASWWPWWERLLCQRVAQMGVGMLCGLGGLRPSATIKLTCWINLWLVSLVQLFCYSHGLHVRGLCREDLQLWTLGVTCLSCGWLGWCLVLSPISNNFFRGGSLPWGALGQHSDSFIQVSRLAGGVAGISALCVLNLVVCCY